MVRRILAAVLLAAMAAQAQLSRTAERIDVNVGEIDVVVLDATGNPVTGLSRNDFELRVGKRSRQITNFYEVNRRLDLAPGGTEPSSKPVEAPVARRDHMLIFVDEVHLNQAEKRRVLDALRGFVRREIRPGTAAMLVDFNGATISIPQRFTEDPAPLLQGIDIIDRKPAHLGEYEAARREFTDTLDTLRTADPKLRGHLSEQLPGMLDRVAKVGREEAERSIDAIGTVVRMIGGLDGRRVLVYVSDGLPMQPGIEVSQLFHPEEFTPLREDDAATYKALTQFQALDTMKHNLQLPLQRLATQAASAGVQFFAIDARGAQAFEELTRSASATLSRVDSTLVRSNVQGPVRFLADETGGQAIVNQNDMNAAFERLSDHLSSYYSLGFRSDGAGREDDVVVRVKRRGLTVRATKHVRQRTAREQIADRVRARLYAPAEDNSLNATIALDPFTGAETGLTLMLRVPLVNLSVLPGQPASFAVAVALLDADNRETAVRMFLHRVHPSEFEESVQTLKLLAAPGSYTVSVAIVDGFSSQASFLQRAVTVPESGGRISRGAAAPPR